MTTIHHPPQNLGSRNQWTISYNQGDVDTIREQIEQTESAKRHWLVLAFLVVLVALAGTIVLLSTNYALYSASKTEKKSLADENTSLKARVDETQQQLDAKTAQEARDGQTRTEAQARLDKLMPAVLNGKAAGVEVANFARLVYYLPNSRVELSTKPPNDLFRN
ncbi:MAG TPA: hypothetical protein VLM38_08530, partial [Blastocatellia bacterium]|nr:hypothetical protein [Blastocatellia bacterium]